MGNRQANKTGRVIRSICGKSKPLQRHHQDSENIFFSLKKNDNIKQTHLNITYNTQNKGNIGNLESALSSFFPRYVWSCSQVHYILLLDKKFNFSTIFVITIQSVDAYEDWDGRILVIMPIGIAITDIMSYTFDFTLIIIKKFENRCDGRSIRSYQRSTTCRTMPRAATGSLPLVCIIKPTDSVSLISIWGPTRHNDCFLLQE